MSHMLFVLVLFFSTPSFAAKPREYLFEARAKSKKIVVSEILEPSAELVEVARAQTVFEPYASTLDSAGKFLYVLECNQEDLTEISVFSFDRLGHRLQLIQHLQTGAFINGQDSKLILAVQGTYAYLPIGGSHFMLRYAVNPNTGELAALDQLDLQSWYPSAPVFVPGSPFLLIPTFEDMLIGTFESDGAIRYQNIASKVYLRSPVFHPTGNFFFATMQRDNRHSEIITNQFDAATGAFRRVGRASLIGWSFRITLDSAGKHLYALEETNGTVGRISQFSIDPMTQQLTSLSTLELGDQVPTNIFMSPSEETVFVTLFRRPYYSVFARDPQTGTLAFVRNVPVDVAHGLTDLLLTTAAFTD